MKQTPQKKRISDKKKREHPHKDLKDAGISIRRGKKSLKKRWEKLLSSSKEINYS